MALGSQLFKGDPALEACLIRDASHVVQGARGDHVSKIQYALSLLDGARIAPEEVTAKNYGRSTADAVLAYKRRRQIINRSYQAQADDIVGKMTIAALDREMLLRENQRTRSCGCGDPVRDPGGVGGQAVDVGAPPQVVSWTFPADLEILWQVTSAGAARGGSGPLAYLNKAIGLLAPFGMNVRAKPQPPFSYEEDVDPRFTDDIWKVRKAAEKATPGSPKILRVILCPFPSKSFLFGVTGGGPRDGTTVPDFILLNVNGVRKDLCTLIHEMVHATGLTDHDSLADSVFSLGPNRSMLRPEHAKRLSEAFFSRKR